jgi:hypothetical protein
MLTRIDLAMRRLPTIAVVIMALLAVGLIGIADWLTGTGISLSMFYIGPVALATWYASKRVGVVTAVLSIAVWSHGGRQYGSLFCPSCDTHLERRDALRLLVYHCQLVMDTSKSP